MQKSSLYGKHFRANWKEKLKCIFSVYSVCIRATSIKITAVLPKHKREEVKLKYPGRTNGHRPLQHHAYSDVRAVCPRTGSASLQETPHTEPLQELQEGLVVAAFPASP